MSTIAFYCWTLALPVVIACSHVLFTWRGSDLSVIAQDLLPLLIVTLIPYGVMLGLFSRTLSGTDEYQYSKMILWAPILFVLLQILSGFILGLCTSTYDNRWAGGTISAGYMLFYGMYTLLFGYVYVALVHLVLWMSRQVNLVD